MTQEQLNVLKSNGIDVDGTLSRFMGRVEMFEKFIFRFLEDKNYSVLCDEIENANVKEAFVAAHTLKGVCANIGLNPLNLAASEITELLRAEKLEEAKEYLPNVKAAYDKMVDVINSVK